VEQATFDTQPADIVPAISFSPDKMLQARLFSYGDAQRCRLGINHRLIPANAPRCPVHSYHCDGAMRVDGNFGGTLGYEPNSYRNGKSSQSFANRRSASKALRTIGTIARTPTTTRNAPNMAQT
jgi:catalase